MGDFCVVNSARLCHVFFRDFSLFLGRSRLLLLPVSPRPLGGQRGLVGRQEHLPWILHGPHLPRNTLRERHDRGISHHKYVFLRNYSMGCNPFLELRGLWVRTAVGLTHLELPGIRKKLLFAEILRSQFHKKPYELNYWGQRLTQAAEGYYRSKQPKGFFMKLAPLFRDSNLNLKRT